MGYFLIVFAPKYSFSTKRKNSHTLNTSKYCFYYRLHLHSDLPSTHYSDTPKFNIIISHWCHPKDFIRTTTQDAATEQITEPNLVREVQASVEVRELPALTFTIV